VLDFHTVCVLPPGMEPASFRFRRRFLTSHGLADLLLHKSAARWPPSCCLSSFTHNRPLAFYRGAEALLLGGRFMGWTRDPIIHTC